MKYISTENLVLLRTELNKRLKALEKEAETIRTDIQAVSRMLERYGGQGQLEILDEITPSATGDEFIKTTLRDAVKIVMQRHFPNSVRVSEIREEIEKGKYPSKSNDIRPAIFAMLSKLISSGEAKKVRKGIYKYVEKEHD